MALTDAQLLAALRLSDSPEETQQVTRLRPVARTMVDQFAPAAPEHIKDEATVRIAGYYFDAPYASRGTSLANALANSGAGALLLPYREHRAGGIRTAPDLGAFDSGFSDAFDTEPLSIGVDQTARDAAAAAQAAADAAQATADAGGSADLADVSDWAETGNADPIPANKLTLTPGAGDIIVQGTAGRLPAGDAVMRIGWALTQAATDLIFTRDGNHPADGAAVGTTSGTAPPAYPAALASEPDLFMFVWIESGDVSDIQFAGGTLLTSGQPLTAYEYDGTAGTIWVSNHRLSPGVSRYPITAIVPGALILTGPDVEAWAKVGDGTAIPVAKLTNVPAGTAVADWAEASNGDQIPANKLGNVPAGTAVADWAEDGNTDAIPADKLTNVPAGGGGGAPTFTELLSATSPEDFSDDTNVDMALGCGCRHVRDRMELGHLLGDALGDHPGRGLRCGLATVAHHPHSGADPRRAAAFRSP